tara:strand:+ start:620 stop:847 length:228 start_codon:yes stop_codon:yes gene_type:complete
MSSEDCVHGVIRSHCDIHTCRIVVDMEKEMAVSQALAEAVGLVLMKHNIRNEEQQWQLVAMLADDMQADMCGVVA